MISSIAYIISNRQLDKLVYKLYDLTAEEIQIIEATSD